MEEVVILQVESSPGMSSDSSCESLPRPVRESLEYCGSPNGQDSHLESKKVKVELCRNYVENGYCVYGERCCFAHGYHQLCMNSSIGNKLKTKQCRLFHKDLVCKYGSRCNFIHQEHNPRHVRVQNYEQTVNMITDYPELLLVIRKRRSILSDLLHSDC